MVIAIVVVILGILFFTLIYGSKYFMGLTILREVKDMDRVLEKEIESGVISHEFLRDLNQEDVEIISRDNLKLRGKYVKGISNNTIVISHGITSGIPASYKYAKPFIEKGWNALMIYHRRHIDSEGKFSTMGYYEKFDLVDWIKFAKEKTSEEGIIGIHGESMGASTAIMASALDEKVDFVVADCGYSDLEELFDYRNKDSKLVGKNLMRMIYIPIKFIAKFSVQEVKPIECVKKSKVPILYIHGEGDDFVPTYMSKNMYDETIGYREIYLVPNAVHAKSAFEDYNKYVDIMMNFVENVMEEQK